MKLFNRNTKRPIKSNPKYEELTLNGKLWKVDKQLIDCIKASAKRDFPDHKPIFDIIDVGTANERYGELTDLVTIDLGDMLVTYTVVERDGFYQPIAVRWEYKR